MQVFTTGTVPLLLVAVEQGVAWEGEVGGREKQTV